MNHQDNSNFNFTHDVEASEPEIPAAHSNNINQSTNSEQNEYLLNEPHTPIGIPATVSNDSNDKFGIDGGGVAIKKSYSFSPTLPQNSPVVLSWKNLTVATTTATPKVLLDNISGSITGGFWAIMGASGGGNSFSILLRSCCSYYYHISLVL